MKWDGIYQNMRMEELLRLYFIPQTVCSDFRRTTSDLDTKPEFIYYINHCSFITSFDIFSYRALREYPDFYQTINVRTINSRGDFLKLNCDNTSTDLYT